MPHSTCGAYGGLHAQTACSLFELRYSILPATVTENCKSKSKHSKQILAREEEEIEGVEEVVTKGM
jgi:hypothetical protein